MAEYSNEKFYWFKLKEDFFKRHDIKIIKAMPNGKDYVIFYLQLLCESLAHNGNLRFNDTIPYNEEMLSIITDTNIDVVRSAMKLLKELRLIEILDDQTIYMTTLKNMIGSTTQGAAKKQEQIARRKAKQLEGGTKVENIPPEIEIEQDIEIDIEIDTELEQEKKSKATNRFTPPTLAEVQAYCKERGNNVDAQRFIDYYTSNGWKVGRNKMKDWKAAVRTWEKSTNKPAPTSKQGGSNGNIFLDIAHDEGLF